VAERTTLHSKAEIHGKFFDCATLALSRGRAEQLAGLVDRLEKVDDVGALMSCMNGNDLKSSTL